MSAPLTVPSLAVASLTVPSLTGRFHRLLPIALVALVASGGRAWSAEATGSAADAARFQQQLAAGEFAPALAATQKLPPSPARDARLAEVARAQAGAGDRTAALTTLAHVDEDRTRSSAIKQTQEAWQKAGARGGSQADFDTLIEMITTTVKPDTWDEVGGPGTISQFNNGVYVDAHGVLTRALAPRAPKGAAEARQPAAKSLAKTRKLATQASDNTNSRQTAPLRKVSLTRLEKHVQLRLAAGRSLSDEMQHLAGLEKIKYVLVYPESGDLVLAGPASDWRRDADGRSVSRATGRPILQLDDLVVVLRYLTASPQGTFGCSIDPTQEGLARTQQYATSMAATPLKPSARGAFLRKLQNLMGHQSISVDGIDPRTRVARVLVEADYRMKLVGMGLEQGTADVPSYLSLVSAAAGQAPPPLDVLRWWFTLKYDVVEATEPRDAFEIRGSGVQVMSENEFLTALGKRVHTGQAQPLNAEFAQRFTLHFEELAKKYPVYADLQNIFDLALVSALVNSERLAERVGWHTTCFLDPTQYQVALGTAPQSVDTVINHRLLNGRNLIVGVSGGVLARPSDFVGEGRVVKDSYGAPQARRTHAQAGELPIEAWWWD
ncbi:MAG: DUF1598 domain-containing protein [Pirellulales bacterium]